MPLECHRIRRVLLAGLGAGLRDQVPVWQALPSTFATLQLCHLSLNCLDLLEKARGMIEVNLIEDPRYSVADDKVSQAAQ